MTALDQALRGITLGVRAWTAAGAALPAAVIAASLAGS